MHHLYTNLFLLWLMVFMFPHLRKWENHVENTNFCFQFLLKSIAVCGGTYFNSWLPSCQLTPSTLRMIRIANFASL
jgi:hypothetical protein